MDTVQLAAQAQEAYELGRIRECLVLTKTLMQADPASAEAQALLAAVREDIQQDLNDARCLLEHSGTQEEKKKYRKAAEIILTKTLHQDPDNEEAKVLLQSARAMSGAYPAQKTDELPFVAAPVLAEKKQKQKKGSRLKLPLAVMAIIAAGAVLLLRFQPRPADPSPPAAQPETSAPFNASSFQPRLPDAASVTDPSQPAGATEPDPATDLSGATPLPAASTLAPPVATGSSEPAAPEMGKLTVTSAIAATIYMGEQYLGSTPTTLELPPGSHKLEYRSGNLRTVASHEIKSNETTSAFITFRVTVQINAKPWAQVFLDGRTRRALGQTPLSGVTVPIGGVLVFENPNFPAKSYKVSEKDTAIQVDLP